MISNYYRLYLLCTFYVLFLLLLFLYLLHTNYVLIMYTFQLNLQFLFRVLILNCAASETSVILIL